MSDAGQKRGRNRDDDDPLNNPKRAPYVCNHFAVILHSLRCSHEAEGPYEILAESCANSSLHSSNLSHLSRVNVPCSHNL